MNKIFKRAFDIFTSLCALFCILPFWAAIALLIKLDSKGPVFYIHTRCGKDGKEFNCYKFRSMRTDADPHTLADSENDPRITRLGKFIRKSSLDETPQLINVLLGDMSIVGPRPALPVQVKHFSDEERLKLSVKPGLTGWTQVNGRNSIPYEKRMELDVWYAKNNNVILDLWIILKTIKVLIAEDSIYDAKSSSPVA
jgi:undecaprenyl phosphate N,N'-diacetylbacillosamine 1-phosphate transferase